MTDLFQHKADDYDTMDLPQQLSAGIGRCMLDNVALQDHMEVMDFGAGTGLLTRHVAARVKRVTAVDVSQAMLDKLASKHELRGTVEVRCQDILERPLDRRFELVVSAMAMHHVHDTALLIKRFGEHLEPGGQLALADLDLEDGTFHPEDAQGVHHAGFDRDALGGLLEAGGFADVRFHDAMTVHKEGRTYPVFLVVARWP